VKRNCAEAPIQIQALLVTGLLLFSAFEGPDQRLVENEGWFLHAYVEECLNLATNSLHHILCKTIKNEIVICIRPNRASMSKAEIKASGIFGYELVEDVVANAVYLSFDGEKLWGTLCRTSSGIRFVVAREVGLALENAQIGTVESRYSPEISYLPWKFLRCKVLTFHALNSSNKMSFIVPNAVAKSWRAHFGVR